MRLEIKNKLTGKVAGVWVARTSRGFNKQQRKEIYDVRLNLALEAGYHLSGSKHCDKCVTPEMLGRKDGKN